ncbi:hypothetical protein CEE44_04430 [Candidatus Woesearchaeota archaeon B3_Woes]|nr:MAG: hypothetical protein CEE44_04430 [Candidatus Woesearchaeota archaeon B3_Woes]
MKKLNFFQKIELIISNPHKFFDKIQDNKNIFDVFKFYFTFIFVSIVINTLFRLPELTKSNLNITISKYFLFILILVAFILILSLLTAVFSFVLYWFCHILIKIFKGKEKYSETYKLLYAATPLLIVSLIPYHGVFKVLFYPLFIIAVLDTFYLEFIGLKKLQKLNKENAITVIVIGTIIAILLVMYFVKIGLIIP